MCWKSSGTACDPSLIVLVKKLPVIGAETDNREFSLVSQGRMSVKEDLLKEIVVSEFPQVVPVIISLHQIILVRDPFFIHDFPVVLGGLYAPGILSSNSEIDIARHRFR